MKNNLFLLLISLGTLWSCKVEELKNDKGNINATVFLYSGFSYTLIKDAIIFTKPASVQATTDEFGFASLKGLEPGTYEVYANIDGLGSGKSVARVSADSLTSIKIYIIEGVIPEVTPEIEVILPSKPALFGFNENIVFSINVKDEDSQPQEIDVILLSNLDGKLLETHPNANNNVRFETSILSKGVHKITIKAIDKNKYTTTKTIDVYTIAPGNIILESATPNLGGVQLQWQKYIFSDFERYEVVRSLSEGNVGEVIASFSSPDSVKYLDKAPPFSSEVYYYIRVTSKNQFSRISNKIKVTEPIGKIYNYNITDAVHHPSQPIVYVIDDDSQKLRAVNYKTQTEIGSINLDETVGKIDIGDNGYGLEIYVPNNSGHIKVYNANTLNLVKDINTGLATTCVVTNGHGYLVASLLPASWANYPVRTYSRSTGLNISNNTGIVYEGNMLRFIPNTDNIISITTRVTPTDMDFIKLDETGNIISIINDSYHSDHPLDPKIFRISSNGEFVITGNVGAVYSATSSMIYKGMVDRASLYFSDFAFSRDGKTIYAGTSNKTSLQIIKYPDLTRNGEILLKGYPKFLFYFDGEIISISKSTVNENKYAFEIKKIE